MATTRIQRKRTKGWRLPENAVCVTRPGRWGNPFRTVTKGAMTKYLTAAEAVAAYRAHLLDNPSLIELAKNQLKGKALACWCPIGSPCHGDVLCDAAEGRLDDLMIR